MSHKIVLMVGYLLEEGGNRVKRTGIEARFP